MDDMYNTIEPILHPNIQRLFPRNAFAMQYSHRNLVPTYASATSSAPALAVSMSTMPCTTQAF